MKNSLKNNKMVLSAVAVLWFIRLAMSAHMQFYKPPSQTFNYFYVFLICSALSIVILPVCYQISARFLPKLGAAAVAIGFVGAVIFYEKFETVEMFPAFTLVSLAYFMSVSASRKISYSIAVCFVFSLAPATGAFEKVPILTADGSFMILIFALIGIILPTPTVDIYSKRKGIAGRLSNFTPRSFVFDDVPCRSIEGVLQSLKFKNSNMQRFVCLLSPGDAKKIGSEQDWKTEQTLYWKSAAYKRDGKEYQAFFDRLYLTVYAADRQFRKDVKNAERCRLTHSIGECDITKTVLTEEEFLKRLKFTFYEGEHC